MARRRVLAPAAIEQVEELRAQARRRTSASPAGTAAIRGRSRRERKRCKSRLHGRGMLRLDLQAKPTVIQNRHRAGRGASLGREEIQVKPCGARPEADVAVNVKIAQVVASDPVPAQEKIIANVLVHR